MFDKANYSRDSLRVDTVHDNRHALPDLDTARESIPYTFHVPELGIAGLTYTWVSHKGEAGAAMALFGPGIGAQPVAQYLADRPVPNDMDFANWHIEGFQMKQDLAFQKAEIRWQGDDVLLEFRFEGSHPPYAYSSHADGCPAYAAHDRIEQSGRCQGKIVIAGNETRFDGMAHRDHSWGTRDWNAFQHYNWFHGQTADGQIAIHYLRCLALGREIIRGYIFKDNTLAEIVSVNSNVHYDDRLIQQQLYTRIVDDLGRSITAEADFYAHHSMNASPTWQLREGAASARFDGQQGLAWVECGWPISYLDSVAPAA